MQKPIVMSLNKLQFVNNILFKVNQLYNSEFKWNLSFRAFFTKIIIQN